MTAKKTFLLLQTMLCALIAGWLAAAAVRMYVEGAAVQASGELFYSIFTREKAAAALRPIAPLFLFSLGVTVSGWILGVKDDAGNAVHPVLPLPARAVPQESGRGTAVARAAVLAAAVIFIVLGVLNGGMEDVLNKAAAICMECIGIG